MHELILGGQKSGKSRAAEIRAAAWLATPGHDALLIATALAGDAEMAARIARHQIERAARVPALRTLEEPRALGATLRAQAAPQRLLLVDCLTLWATNLLMPLHGPSLDEAAWDGTVDDLVAALASSTGPVVLVSNEIGLGLSPLSPEARRCVDALGTLHQRLGRACERVTLMVAGRALALPRENA
ncbi:bifunctional adenosylcobinamide kinase/adenosylcobinamide-phosphate guanylyltransferase [Aquincola sp. S2]|uniref:Bifunctional adenosylcobalamin biosynthesis protein n=1 Tax=Pseudaquabacterium terrae TaxID=2732868 RepID=A0ABX2EPG8_9BURK|nr:bifunctional adenosylcobinamide kinase/adenosylcobinamide-phosphate guanylyltransferase [Aquabacterium terrae]NRF70469.1 bifunctional adenosylcobinamide kinase/adenosylcobinamide-phosphate guanylyltransferase [Aquabacterium terrae]